MSAKLDPMDEVKGVIVADSYNKRFGPLTRSKRPRALIPVCNIPLIDYTLELFYRNGIKECFIVTNHGHEEIEKHLNRVSDHYANMTLNTIHSTTTYNLGDALRLLHDRIRTNFVLVTGDVISNIDLTPLMAKHKNWCSLDKKTLMTMLFTPCDHSHPLRNVETDVVVVRDTQTSRLLFCGAPTEKHLEVPLYPIMERSQVELRFDVVESHIYLCSPTLLDEFVDHFDYCTMANLIKGVIDNDDIVSNKVYAVIQEEKYAARCANLTSYDAISKDVMNRWCYDLVPDIFGPPARGSKYIYRRNHIYVEKSAKLGRNCQLLSSVVVGSNAEIAYGKDHDGTKNKTKIKDSVLGNWCKVGTGCNFDSAYCFDGVTIGNNCSISHAILGNNVTILDNVNIGEGCVIENCVVLGPNVTIAPHTFISLRDEHGRDAIKRVVSRTLTYDYNDDEQHNQHMHSAEGNLKLGRVASVDVIDEYECAHELVGIYGRGFLYNPAEEDSIDVVRWQLESMEDSDSDDSDDGSDFELDDSDDENPIDVFTKEVLDLLQSRMDLGKLEETSVSNIQLEITGSRAAHNIPVEDVPEIITSLLFERVVEDEEYGDSKNSWLPKVFQTMGPLLANYTRGKEEQFQILDEVLGSCQQYDIPGKVYLAIVNQLYEQDVVGEDAILEWHKVQEEFDEEKLVELHKSLEKFVAWLENADEEESEESSAGEEETSEEEEDDDDDDEESSEEESD